VAAGKEEHALGQVINIASGQEISIRELIRTVHKLTKSKSTLRFGALPYRPTEIWRMCGDNTRAQDILKWRPLISFEQGLAKTIEWYQKYLKVYQDKQSQLNLLCD